MIVRVRLFAAYRERAGGGQVEVDVPVNATVADVAAALVERYPALRDVLGSGRPVVNQQFVAPDTAVGPADDVAFIPPVSGGSRG